MHRRSIIVRAKKFQAEDCQRVSYDVGQLGDGAEGGITACLNKQSGLGLPALTWFLNTRIYTQHIFP